MELNTILEYNVQKTPWPMPDKSVNCIVTSPPYWALRNYGVAGQLGMEETPEEYIRRMVLVFREAWRVLRDDGTLWLNIGDTYAASGRGGGGGSIQNEDVGREITADNNRRKPVPGYKKKDLVGIPWMLAFALREAGWYLRQDIIWHKPNPMPESATDRCTKAHEYIFLFSKSPKYYYDALAIATPYKDKTYTTFGIEAAGNGDGTGMVQSENWHKDVTVRKPKKWKTPDGWDTSGGGHHGSFHKNGRESSVDRGKRDFLKTPLQEAAAKDEVNGRGMIGHSGIYGADGKLIGNGKANKRSVWTVGTQRFKEAHFATFPIELIWDCVLAGCPGGGVVFDPFMGAGTTALVARLLDRNFFGLELNPKYIKIANNRLKKELGLFL